MLTIFFIQKNNYSIFSHSHQIQINRGVVTLPVVEKTWARKKPWAPVCMGRQYKNQNYIWKILFHIVRLSYTHHTIIIQQIGKCLIL